MVRCCWCVKNHSWSCTNIAYVNEEENYRIVNISRSVIIMQIFLHLRWITLIGELFRKTQNISWKASVVESPFIKIISNNFFILLKQRSLLGNKAMHFFFDYFLITTASVKWIPPRIFPWEFWNFQGKYSIGDLPFVAYDCVSMYSLNKAAHSLSNAVHSSNIKSSDVELL